VTVTIATVSEDEYQLEHISLFVYCCEKKRNFAQCKTFAICAVKNNLFHRNKSGPQTENIFWMRTKSKWKCHLEVIYYDSMQMYLGITSTHYFEVNWTAFAEIWAKYSNRVYTVQGRNRVILFPMILYCVNRSVHIVVFVYTSLCVIVWMLVLEIPPVSTFMLWYRRSNLQLCARHRLRCFTILSVLR